MTTCPWPNKIPYDTHAAARRQLLQWRKRGKAAGRVRVYRCLDHWHLGHKRQRRRRKAKSTAA